MLRTRISHHFFFSLLLGLGLSYTAFLGLALTKVHAGFLMQFIFLLDSIKTSPASVLSLISSSEFLLNTLSGLILTYLFSIFFRGLLQTAHKLHLTRAYQNNLKIIASFGNFYLFTAPGAQIFTSGFLFPKVYLTPSVLSLSDSELSAVLIHEYQHQQNHDPLKSFLVGLVSSFTPSLPFKDYLFGHYDSLTEINADLKAEIYLKNKLPLISALHKFTSPPVLGFQSFFSAQNHRFRCLVGEQRLSLAPLFALNTTLILILILFTTYLSNSDIFYHCAHLIDCFKATLLTSHETMTSLGAPLSAHCSSLAL